MLIGRIRDYEGSYHITCDLLDLKNYLNKSDQIKTEVNVTNLCSSMTLFPKSGGLNDSKLRNDLELVAGLEVEMLRMQHLLIQ